MGDDVTVFDLFDPTQPRSSEEIKHARLAVCNTCEFFLKGSKRCKLCGCFMSLKTTLELAKCPMGYWEE
jgi:hypothetical protein